MRFSPVCDAVEAVPVDLLGASLMVVALGDRAHVVDRGAFELLFQVAPAPTAARGDTADLGAALAQMAAASVAPAVASEQAVSPRRQKRAAAPVVAPKATADPAAAEAGPASEQKPKSKELSDYPATLRDARATSLRTAYDALMAGPAALGAVVIRCRNLGWTEAESGVVMKAICKLKEKRLARKADATFGGDWMLI
jgi:hypothetical protein